jgi:hypothetical protein
MTHHSRSEWTRLDLEMYLDEALAPAASDRLAEALRESPQLRERLSNAARLDAFARAALAEQQGRPPLRVSPARRIALGVAALLAVALGAAALFPRDSSIDTTQHDTPLMPHSPAMVVWSFPAGSAPTPHTEPEQSDKALAASEPAEEPHRADSSSPPTASQFRRRLDAAIARGDAAAAAQLLATSDDALRVEGYRRLGAVLRSVSTARRVLEDLPVGEQLAACRELAVEPRWRTVAASRLTSLHDDPANRAAVEALLSELTRSPELVPLVERVRARKARGVPGESI